MEAHCPHGTFASSREPGNYETLFFLMELSQHGLAPSCTYIWLSPRSLTQLSFQCSLSAAQQHKSGQPTTAWKKSVGSRKIRESKSIFAKNGRLQMKEFRSTAMCNLSIPLLCCIGTRLGNHSQLGYGHGYVYGPLKQCRMAHSPQPDIYKGATLRLQTTEHHESWNIFN